MNGDIIIYSHQIQSVGCWSPCALCHGVRSCEWCGASCCCRPSSSLCLGPHRGLCWRVLGNPLQSDGVDRRFGAAPCRAAPFPIEYDRHTCGNWEWLNWTHIYIKHTHKIIKWNLCLRLEQSTTGWQQRVVAVNKCREKGKCWMLTWKYPQEV